MLVLGGLILAALVLRLAVPRGIWLDEAITIHQAHLSLHDLFRNLYFGDRQPPLYHLVLWTGVRVFGNGEFAVRLPSLIAGTLVIPVLYELGRELYDRRTGLIAATFAAGSPSGTYDLLSFYSVLSNMAWALWGYQPDVTTVLLAAMWPLFLLLSLALLGRGGSRQTVGLAGAAVALVALLVIVSAFD